ncbi:MSCRAMM family protein [Leifsonia shinshuensis]|uniref:MSCRAMM family protein n=1 Tax=Leifsonia shinshuensis TaxID=150026 RepID=UPI0021564538|nr:carboxypeptidase regulatory-like domain-containing protein [Leifsonia shinshuensis]
MRSRLLVPAAIVAAIALPTLLASPASAATTGLWAGWSTTGTNSFTVQVANTPAISATVTTDSRQGQIGVISGASTWLGAGTPVGAKYGSSQGKPYLNLRPKADSPSAPSTTTYSFAAPTPTSGWTFVLGDIDADAVQVRAIGPDGALLTAAQLGYRGGFNYCAPGVAGKPSCTGSATDIPSWDPATLTLTGNAAATDTNGSAGWFEPNAPISALTFLFRQRSGLPVYQTWFASLARDITGTVTATTGSAAGATLTLRDADGAVVATTTSAADGSYSFAGVQASAGYTVTFAPPAGSIADGARTKPADLSAADAVVDFATHVIVPVAVGGTVRDTDGAPVPNATVQLAPGLTTTTGPDGGYLFDTAAVGTYQVQVVGVPAGYTVLGGPVAVTVPPGSETPIGGVDFTLRASPDLTGTVADAGGGVAGVVVTATSAGGSVSAVTEADGSYRLPGLAAGGYTVTVAAPPGYSVSGPASRAETVATADVTGVDFALTRSGAVEGTVASPAGPVAGAEVIVQGMSGTIALTTGADGTYATGGLAAGVYTITVTPPAGYVDAGASQRTVTITAAGESVTGQDFALAAAATPPPPPAPPASGGGPSGTGASTVPTGELADTGSDAAPAAAAGLLAIAGGAALTIAGRARRMRSSTPMR